NLISTMVKASLGNASNLLNEAKILADNNRIERAFFLTVIAVEEMGKATMYNNSVQYGDDNNLFRNKFNKFKTKHSFKIFKSIVLANHLNMDFNLDFTDAEILSKDIDALKMSSLYVDLKSGKVVSPVTEIKAYDFKKMSEFASQLMNRHLYFLENGFYDVEFYGQVRDFYSDDEIQDLQKRLFIGELSQEDYLSNLIGKAVEKKDNIFAQILILSIYLSLSN
ncbi:MAG: AbiV family abortive infection protein, partial [Actinobacteria bacterium]|nr:AbiV family abortive infection protein [Actinomycetota bacterium]